MKKFIAAAILIAITIYSVFFLQNNFLQTSKDSAQPTTVTLMLNQPVALKNANSTATLTQVVIPSEGCRDCITGANILLSKNGEQQTMTFKIGGIAGLMEKEKEAFNYLFILKDLDKTSVTLTYEPK